MNADFINICYLFTAITFMLALKLMNGPKTARQGNLLAAAGMGVALIATFFIKDENGKLLGNFEWIALAFVVGSILGTWSARKVQMTAMPQLVALFNGLGGGAVALVAVVEYPHLFQNGAADKVSLLTTVLSLLIGAISFMGSLMAYGKLQELLSGRPITWPGQKILNLLFFIAAIVMIALLLSGTQSNTLVYALLGLSLLLGITLVLPIGGADMPVVISLLNSFTGCAAGLAGFVLNNTALLIGGGLVGASGLILTLGMCKAMNRPLSNVIFGAFGSAPSGDPSLGSGKTGNVRSYSVEDAAIIFSNANSVIIVPGYGMAVAQAQHVVKEFAAKLAERDIEVKYAIHPVAGRMPGHMNVLLAEADVSYDQLFDLDEINSEFPETDVALVIGANDVVNPAARYDKASPIYGMPILDVDKSRTVIVLKRSMSPGFAGIDNELFINPNTIMVFGNAKTTISKLSAAMDSV